MAPASSALRAFSWKPQVPRRMSATLPVRLPGAGGIQAGALQASAADVAVPVRASGKVPESGEAGEPVARL